MLKPRPSPWFISHNAPPAPRLRLFCFPHAGGFPGIFAAWRGHFPETIEVLTAQLPGHGARIAEPLLTSIESLVAAAGPALLARAGDVPFALFGHSMGTMVAFELARWLRRRDERAPLCLVVAGRRAPQLPETSRLVHGGSAGDIVAELKRLNGTPDEVLENRELVDLLVPIVRADYKAIETYHYEDEPPLPCPVAALGGFEDPETTPDNLDAWRAQSSVSFSLHMFEGGHFFVHTHRAQVLPLMCQILDKARSAT